MTPKEIRLSTTVGGPKGDHHFVVLEIPASKKRNPNMDVLHIMDDLAEALAHAHTAPNALPSFPGADWRLFAELEGMQAEKLAERIKARMSVASPTEEKGNLLIYAASLPGHKPPKLQYVARYLKERRFRKDTVHFEEGDKFYEAGRFALLKHTIHAGKQTVFLQLPPGCTKAEQSRYRNFLLYSLAHAHAAPAREEPAQSRDLPDFGPSVRKEMSMFAQKYAEFMKSQYEKTLIHASMNSQGCPVMWLHFENEESVPPMEKVGQQLKVLLKNEGIELRHLPKA